MKLRIQGNSIRLRLGRSEVERFDATGHIEESLDFGPMGRFTYGLDAGENFTPECIYSRYGIRIAVPRGLAQNWTRGDHSDISAAIGIDGYKTIQILIEKDFQCLHKDDTANADAYPNPLSK